MSYPLTTTLNRIWACYPCEEGKREALVASGKDNPDDEPITYEAIIEAAGVENAIWCMRAEPQHEREWRLFAVWCARQVQHLMADERSIAAVDVAERYANGRATREELAAAREAARDTARDAAWATAWETAWATAWEAAWEAAWASAREAAWASAREAARDTARDAAWATAWETAWATAWETAREAAWEAAWEAQRQAFIQLVSTGTLPAGGGEVQS